MTKKNTKAVKTVKHWFESRNHGKAEITAIRLKPEAKKIEYKGRQLKSGGNMYYVKEVLSKSGRIELNEAVKRFLEVHPVASKNPELRTKTIFMQANQYHVPVKIEKVGKETFLELA